jgi:hypothetical protein
MMRSYETEFPDSQALVFTAFSQRPICHPLVDGSARVLFPRLAKLRDDPIFLDGMAQRKNLELCCHSYLWPISQVRLGKPGSVAAMWAVGVPTVYTGA